MEAAGNWRSLQQESAHGGSGHANPRVIGGLMVRSGRRGIVHNIDTTLRVRTRILVIAVATLVIAGWVAALTAPVSPPATAATTSASSNSARWIGIAATPDSSGYWLTSSGGEVDAFGDAAPHGDMTGTTLNQPVVGMAATPSGGGYWLDAADGGIFTFGNARFWGSTGSVHLNKPVVGMAPTHDGGGYWMVASDGGIFAFGDAAFEGSMGSRHLNEPIVAMAPTHDGRGYWLVASDGGIFAFGDATFKGSLGSSPPTSPIVNMTPTPDNNGYWLVSQNGKVYAFGDATNYGSVSAPTAPVTSLAAASTGGYWVLTADGTVHPFGDATNYGLSATGPAVAPSAPAPSGVAAASTSSNSNTGSVSAGVLLSNTTTSSSVASLTPSSGTAGGGSTVHITGSGLTGTLAVYFGTNASSDFTVNSSTSITAVAPVGSGTVDVRIVMPDGTTSTNSGDRFTYAPTGQLPITAQGQHLEIGGAPTLFTGFNAYQLATDFGTNSGCGSEATPAQIAAFFASLRPNSLVRFWAFQESMATNVHTGQLDWAPIDNVFYQAAKYHVYLIPVISDQSGTCDGGHWQDPNWYSFGFRNVYNSPDNSDGLGLTPYSYWSYMNAIRESVCRFTGAWDVGAHERGRGIDVSGGIRTDELSGTPDLPQRVGCRHGAGVLLQHGGGADTFPRPQSPRGGGSPGRVSVWHRWQLLPKRWAVPGVDVLSVHDYYGSAPMGGDPWNGLAERFTQAKALNKPIITGEAGIVAGNNQSGCESLQQRASDMAAKMSAQFAAGDSAFLVWDWITDPLGGCSTNTGPTDTSLLNSLLNAIASPPAG